MSSLRKLTSKPFSALFQARSYTNASNLSNTQVMLHRAQLFEAEKLRQETEVERVEKIEVKYIGPSNECNLIMNKDLSTPYNCAMHLSETLCQRSVLALVDDEPWDMHRPLEKDCNLKFQHFKEENPLFCNKAYWRSCSFILGYLMETAFKDKYFVDIYSFPPPIIKSGSFVYDVQLNIPNWKPSSEELRCLTMCATKLVNQNFKFERLKIKKELADEMFKYNVFKLKQVPSVAQADPNGKVTVYKVGDFVDMSKGPMISNTSLIGRFAVTGIFDIKSSNGIPLQRIQGVSIPEQLHLHFWTFDQLVQRASKLNNADSKISFTVPQVQQEAPTIAQKTA